MATQFTAADICEQALRKIGRVPPHEQPSAEDMKIALLNLELVLNHTAGSGSVTSMWKTIEIPVVASDNSYNIADLNIENGLQFVFAAVLRENASKQTSPIVIMRENEFNKLDSDETGIIDKIFVDRTKEPSMKVHPMLGPEVANGTYTILLHIQTYGTEIDSASTGAELLNLRFTWYLWAYHRLAYVLGSGPIRTLPEPELARIDREYNTLESQLKMFDNQETDDQPFTQSWGQ